MLKHLIICNIFVIIQVVLCFSNTPQEYGEFTMNISEVTIFKGPKRSDCTNNTVKIENGTKMLIAMDIKRNVIPNRGKVTIMVNGKVLVRMQMKKPCDHVFLKPLLPKVLNVTENCEFIKGFYNINMDIDNLAQKFYGGMFFYGKFLIKVVIHNDDCNFFCGDIKATLSPKVDATAH